MAYIAIRVSGQPAPVADNPRRPNRVRRTFRDDRQGRADRDTFVSELSDVNTMYDVRYSVNGRLALETFDTKRDADRRKSEVEVATAKGRAVDPADGRITVDRLAERWLASDPGKRGSTIGRDRSALCKHIIPAMGSRTIDSIRQPHVQELVNGWATKVGPSKKGLAPRTVDRTYGTLRAMFGYAVTAGLIGTSPCHHINLPDNPRKQRRVVSPDDVGALADAMDERYAPMVWIGALLGLRWGEVAGLRVRHLDLLGRSLTVAEQVTRDEHGKPVMGPPKSDAGMRSLSMPQTLADMLAKHLAGMDLTAADSDALIFPAPAGGPWAYGNFRRRIWQPAVALADLAGVGFHDLRRTAGTQLVLGGVDLKTIGNRLGHSDPRLTLAVYAQATQGADRAAADVLGDQFAEAMGFGIRDRIATESPAQETAGIDHVAVG